MNKISKKQRNPRAPLSINDKVTNYLKNRNILPKTNLYNIVYSQIYKNLNLGYSLPRIIGKLELLLKKSNFHEELDIRLDILLQISKRGVTRNKLLVTYGLDEGFTRWNEYRRLQAITNTFEYKAEKYGITEIEFKDFNTSRAITADNMIKKYGVIEGMIKFNSYCKKQSYAGNKEEYFVEKLGEIAGKERYLELNKRKALNLQNFILKYGEELGNQKWQNYIQFSYSHYSISSQELFNSLHNRLVNFTNIDKIYYATKDKEFGKMTPTGYVKYDFVDTYRKIVIEFNGDYWHANPTKYHPDDKLDHKGGNIVLAKDVWKKDEEKFNLMKNEGYNVIVVWESDYLSNKEKMVNRIIDELYRK